MSQSAIERDYSDLGVGNRRGALGTYANSTNRCTTSFLRKNWGEPESRQIVDQDQEIWTYDHGLKWAGASPILLFPLPFFIPVGREKIHFTLNGENVISIHHETIHRTLAYVPLVYDDNITVGITMHGPPGTEEDCLFKK